MLTGGITRRTTAEQALADGVALIEMGTALAVTPDLPARWRNGREADRHLRPVIWLDKALASAAGMAQVRHQLRRLARGTHPTPPRHPPGLRPAHRTTPTATSTTPLPHLAAYDTRHRNRGSARVSTTTSALRDSTGVTGMLRRGAGLVACWGDVRVEELKERVSCSPRLRRTAAGQWSTGGQALGHKGTGSSCREWSCCRR